MALRYAARCDFSKSHHPIHFHAIVEHQVVAGYNYGAYKLSDYRLNIPETNAAFLRVNRISEALTPRLIQTFYRSNFTMTRPWLTRILRHMSFLPPSMPGPDEAQVWLTLSGPGYLDCISQRVLLHLSRNRGRLPGG